MLRMKYLIATCVLALTVGAANADTYDVFTVSGSYALNGCICSGLFSGSLTEDVTIGGIITSAEITTADFGNFSLVPPGAPSYVNGMFELLGHPTYYVLNLQNERNGYLYQMQLDINNPLGSVYDPNDRSDLAGFIGSSDSGACPIICAYGFAGVVSPGNPTPIPAALPLFATGLGALGLLGWRRKRKVALAA